MENLQNNQNSSSLAFVTNRNDVAFNPLSPEGGEFSPPLEKTYFRKADISDLLNEILKTESSSEWLPILAMY